MRILFCQNPIEPKKIDVSYEKEYQCAKENGFAVSLIDFESLTVEKNAKKTIKNVPFSETEEIAMYRGWMMTPLQYEMLYEALKTKNVKLVNHSNEYKYCHYLPENYVLIGKKTPQSDWLFKTEFNIENIKKILQKYKNKSVIIKDFVKSRKHEWKEAFFIPDASDTENALKVVQTFIERQGEDLNEGIVIREFVEFEGIGTHPKSQMPLTNEHRLFFYKKELLLLRNYWEEVEYLEETIPLETFQDIIEQVNSQFFVMDIAKRNDGKWMVMELGDGGVSGFPDDESIPVFYRKLSKM